MEGFEVFSIVIRYSLYYWYFIEPLFHNCISLVCALNFLFTFGKACERIFYDPCFFSCHRGGGTKILNVVACFYWIRRNVGHHQDLKI